MLGAVHNRCLERGLRICCGLQRHRHRFSLKHCNLLLALSAICRLTLNQSTTTSRVLQPLWPLSAKLLSRITFHLRQHCHQPKYQRPQIYWSRNSWLHPSCSRAATRYGLPHSDRSGCLISQLPYRLHPLATTAFHFRRSSENFLRTKSWTHPRAGNRRGGISCRLLYLPANSLIP